tara:strand:+ start:301 stop:441 length:141 start_codon:yes stop_codon:yes gene_type:complete
MDIPKGVQLIELDHTLFVELEDSEEADHDFDPIYQPARQASKGRSA